MALSVDLHPVPPAFARPSMWRLHSSEESVT
jgi:hypothetical protein